MTIRVMNPKARTHDRASLADSLARIRAACTEPGNAPAGAPYPFNPNAEEATMQTMPTTKLVTNVSQLPDHDGECRNDACSAAILWTVTTKGTRMPVDLFPAPDGNMVLELLDDPDPSKQTRFRALVLAKDDIVDASALRFTSHFATCSAAGKFRKDRRR